MTDLVMFTIRLHGKMGQLVITYVSLVITISSLVQLQKAQKRKQKEPSTSDTCDDVPEEPPTPKRLRSSVGEPFHDKRKCDWCMEGEIEIFKT